MKLSMTIDVVGRADAAPERGRNAGRLLAHVFDALVGNVVGHVDRAIDGVGVDAVLERGREEPRHDRGADDAMAPGDGMPCASRPAEKRS